MPLKLREECDRDPSYHVCRRRVVLEDHVCFADPANIGRDMVEWEHALYFQGKQVQEKWAIVPLCWWAHRGPGLNKQINVWLALNAATEEQLRSISKVVDYVEMRERLNRQHGAPGVPLRGKAKEQ